MITITLVEGQLAPFEKYVDQEMIKTVKYFEHELVGIRSGRAHASMVENIKVSCYGGDSELPLKNLASISTPEARLIVIQPWDQATMPDIERALSESDLGINPLNDGNVIRLQLQEMSSERRDELVKVLGKKLEESRVSIRSIRKDLQNFIRDAEKEKTVSEDFVKRVTDVLEKITARYIKQVEDLAAKKSSELKG